MQFLANFISLVQFFGYFWPKNRSNEVNSPQNALAKSTKIALAKNLANAKFS
jgi:hypothetical protein